MGARASPVLGDSGDFVCATTLDTDVAKLDDFHAGCRLPWTMDHEAEAFDAFSTKRFGDRPFLERSLWLPCHSFRDEHTIPTLAYPDERDVIFLDDPRAGSSFFAPYSFPCATPLFGAKTGMATKDCGVLWQQFGLCSMRFYTTAR
jgi:hypothetical protein